MSSNTKAFEDKMKSAVEHLERELKTVRAGRANPGVLDKVTVDYYGSPTPIQQVASVAVSEARTLTITPWDRTLLRAISKAILASDVGINPIDDGQTIRLNFPAPTEERRKQLAKEVSKMGEEAKVAVRTAARVNRVDLHKSPAPGRDRGIARDRQKRDRVRVRIQMGDDDGVGAVAIAVGAADENVIHAVAQRLGLLGGHVLLRLLLRLKLLRCDWNGGRLRRFFLGGRLRLGERRTLHRLHQQLPRRERASGDCQHDHRRNQRRACTARQRGLFCMRRTAAIAK